MKLSSFYHRNAFQNLAWILTLCIMNCADNGTKPGQQETSSALLTSSIGGISSAGEVSSSELNSIPASSSQEFKISSDQMSSSGISRQSLSSSLGMSSSSTNSSILSSSSQVVQPLQFQGAQVRIPDGCGVIHWANGDEFTCVQDFWVDTTEVTIGAYQALMNRGVSSQFHNGIYKWKNRGGDAYIDDGSLCPQCPVDAATLYEAMLYANAMTKAVLHSMDTVYRYTGIDSVDGPGIYLKIKGHEITGLQNLVIDSSKSGFRLPTRGEFQYMCLKENLISYPWEDLYPATTGPLYVDDLYAWNNQNSEGVTRPVATKLSTSWHLYDLIGNADEWTTTPDQSYPGEFMALGGSAMLNGAITSDLRMDSKRAGFRLVRGKSRHEMVPLP